VTAVIIVGACALLAKPFLKIEGPAYTSVFQGVIRWNSFVFLPVIQATFGAEGLALAAVMIASIIPVTNIACVAVLARWGADQRGVSPLALTRAMLANPILVACLTGLALNVLKVPPIPGVSDTLELLGAAALPLGLIVAGAGLSFAEVARRKGTIAAVTFVKLGIMPPLMWGLCFLYGGDQTAQGAALLCGAAPGAAAAYLLARQMGGDAPLMAGIVASTTVGSALTIPILLALFHLV
jgi:predicted permease